MSELLGGIQEMKGLVDDLLHADKSHFEEAKRQNLEKLRDHFASIVLESEIAAINLSDFLDQPNKIPVIADVAYNMADAMMQRRAGCITITASFDSSCGPEDCCEQGSASAWNFGQPPVSGSGKLIMVKFGGDETSLPIVVALYPNGVYMVGTGAVRSYSSVSSWCEIPK